MRKIDIVLKRRTRPHLNEERALQQAGFSWVAGVDEAGRGAWAGPVVAAAVILPPQADRLADLRGANDSKQLSAAQRAALRVHVERHALAWAVGAASNAEIDAIGILPATRLAMMRAVASLAITPQALLIDAVKLPQLKLPQKSFNFADSISLSVACASILAKTARDAMMCCLEGALPGYGFAAHKGYGTGAHALALRERGPAWVHRHTFAPIRNMASDQNSRSASQTENRQ